MRRQGRTSRNRSCGAPPLPPSRRRATTVRDGRPSRPRGACRHHEHRHRCRSRSRSRSRTGDDRPGCCRSAPVRRDPARTRLRRGHVRPCASWTALLVHNRRWCSMSYCGNRPKVPSTRSGPDGLGTPRQTELRAPCAAAPSHSASLIRNAGPGTLSMSSADTAWPRSHRIWAATCAPHPRCRASTAGPSGSAR
jgi:hypothetical protein